MRSSNPKAATMAWGGQPCESSVTTVVTTATTLVVAQADIYAVQAALPPRFRNAPGAAWVANVAQINRVRQRQLLGNGGQPTVLRDGGGGHEPQGRDENSCASDHVCCLPRMQATKSCREYGSIPSEVSALQQGSRYQQRVKGAAGPEYGKLTL